MIPVKSNKTFIFDKYIKNGKSILYGPYEDIYGETPPDHVIRVKVGNVIRVKKEQ